MPLEDIVIPPALATLLDRGLLPQATLLVGGNSDRWMEVIQRVTQQLKIAPADIVIVREPPAMNDLRRLLEQIHLKPFQSPLTLVALCSLELWSEPLATVLLKTLEEPPAHTRLLLLATESTAILPTILSRVARFRFPPTPQTSDAERESTTGPLSQWFEWSKEKAAGESTITESIQALLAQTSDRTQQRALLQALTAVATHPINKRLALDAAVLAQYHQEVLP